MPSDSINSLLAGTTGGIAVTLVGHGFDTVKVKMQTATTSTSVVSTVSSIYKEDGIRGFYKGVGSPLAGQMFFRSVLFFSLSEAKMFTTSTLHFEPNTFTHSFVAGALAGAAASTAECPVDFFKTQKQVRSSKDNVFVLGKKLVDQFGTRIAYQGFSGTLIRNIPANAIYFGAFDEMKRRNPFGFSSAAPNALVAGGTGGFLYWLLNYPSDVIKSSMQSRDPATLLVGAANGNNNRSSNSWLSTAQRLFKEGGAKRFTRGLTPCLMRAIPANGIMLTVVDTVKDFLQKRSASK